MTDAEPVTVDAPADPLALTLGPRDVARILGVDWRTATAWMAAGVIRCVDKGRHRARYYRTSAAWLDEFRRAGPANGGRGS